MAAKDQLAKGNKIDPEEETTNSHVTVVYPSWVMRNGLASLVNLVTLLIGIAIGIVLAPHVERPVQAVAQVPPSSGPGAPQAPQMLSGNPNVVQVQPAMTAGTVGAYLFLAHHIQSDELVVNGYDVMKLQNAQLQMLSRFVPASAIQSAVNQARADTLYQVAPSNKTPPAPAPKK